MADSPELMRRKATLRTVLLAGRARRSTEQRAAADALAAVLVERLAGAAVVATYLPAPEEPGHGRLPGALSGRLLLPVVPASGREPA
jgi:5-formyltetrahydrofolate cyclo-ligase